ncbi:MAG: hypothetical protein ACPGEG_08345 [Salibacteraceae bacterium]
MKHIYTPKEYLNLESLQEELKDVEIESIGLPKMNPKSSTLKFLMNYSKALEVKKLKGLGNFETILN